MSDIKLLIGDPAKDLDRLVATERGSFDGLFMQRDQIHTADEFTLLSQIAADRTRRLAAAVGGPGFSALDAFQVLGGFLLGVPYCRAIVGDEAVFLNASSTAVANNVVVFDSPPGGGTRWDLLILESWIAEVGSIGSADATSKALPAHGNIDGTDLAAAADYAIKNPEIAGETARRTQVRWRLRVIEGVNLATYPQGLGDPACLAQGGAGSPVAGYAFAEDPALPDSYVAGTADATAAAALGAATGLVRAIPMLALLRTAGESALTLTGSRDLRRPIGGGAPVQATGAIVQVFRAGNFGVGISGDEESTWRQAMQGAAQGMNYDTITSATTATPLTSVFPFFASDFHVNPGYTLKGRLYGVLLRPANADFTTAVTLGLRIRKPGAAYGTSVASATWAMGPVTSSDGVTKKIEDQIAAFDIPVDGTGDGVWVVELYSTSNQVDFESSGIWMRVYAEQSA